MKVKFKFPCLRPGSISIPKVLFALPMCMSVYLPIVFTPAYRSSEVKWKGTVHYRYEYKKIYQWNESNRHCSLNANSNWDSTLDIFMIVSFDGREGGSSGDPRIRADYRLLINTECQWARDHEVCAGKVEINAATWKDREKGTRRVSPGHSGKMTTALDTRGNKSEASLDFFVDQESGTFTLIGQGEVKAPQPAFKSEKVFRDACSGQTDRKTEHQTYPDTGAMWFFNVMGKFSGNTISGTQVLEDDTAIPEGEKDTPTSNAHMSCNFPSFRSAPIEYLKSKTVSWNFRRVGEDDCVGMVTFIRGDVTINGQKPDIGPLPLPGGSSIETGPGGRIMIVFPEQGVEYRIGSNTSLKIPDPCKKVSLSPEKLMRGMLYVMLSGLVGGTDKSFQINCGWGGSGVRGLPLPIAEDIGQPLWLGSVTKPLFIRALSAHADNQPPELTELAPNNAEIEEADRIFTIERIPDDYLRVRAFKGAIKLRDSSGEVRPLESGENFRKSLKQGEEAGPMKEIFVVVDRL